jgi:hypothetical protein
MLTDDLKRIAAMNTRLPAATPDAVEVVAAQVVTDEMVEAAIDNCPSPYEIDMADLAAFRKMLEAALGAKP